MGEHGGSLAARKTEGETASKLLKAAASKAAADAAACNSVQGSIVPGEACKHRQHGGWQGIRGWAAAVKRQRLRQRWLRHRLQRSYQQKLRALRQLC